MRIALVGISFATSDVPLFCWSWLPQRRILSY